MFSLAQSLDVPCRCDEFLNALFDTAGVRGSENNEAKAKYRAYSTEKHKDAHIDSKDTRKLPQRGPADCPDAAENTQRRQSSRIPSAPRRNTSKFRTHVQRKRPLERGDLRTVHGKLGGYQPIPRFFPHILEQAIHFRCKSRLGAIAKRQHPTHRAIGGVRLESRSHRIRPQREKGETRLHARLFVKQEALTFHEHRRRSAGCSPRAEPTPSPRVRGEEKTAPVCRGGNVSESCSLFF